ncbi:MAG: hypothetical protein ACKOCK_13750 [Chloroflexota bacterium]
MSRELRLPEEGLSAEPGRYGCPMLVRSLSGEARGLPLMRCSLGWALHNELDADKCRATEIVTDCWQANLERPPVIVLELLEPEPETETAEAPETEEDAETSESARATGD